MKTEKNLNKNYLSLASLMFFAPFVQDLLKNGHLHLDEEEQSFIKSYIKYGYLNITILSVLIIISIINFFLKIEFINTLLTVGLIGIISSLVIGVFCVFSGKTIFKGEGTVIQWKEIEKHNADILLSFIPGYNIYLWYKVGHFDHPYYWLKESLIIWTLYVFLTLSIANTIVSSFILILIFVRIIFLLGGIDLIYDHIKHHLNSLFETNIEELWGYPKGVIVWSINTLFHRKATQDLSSTINESKQEFQSLSSWDHNISLLIQYAILVGILGRWSFNLFVNTAWEFVTI